MDRFGPEEMKAWMRSLIEIVDDDIFDEEVADPSWILDNLDYVLYSPDFCADLEDYQLTSGQVHVLRHHLKLAVFLDPTMDALSSQSTRRHNNKSQGPHAMEDHPNGSLREYTILLAKHLGSRVDTRTLYNEFSSLGTKGEAAAEQASAALPADETTAKAHSGGLLAGNFSSSASSASSSSSSSSFSAGRADDVDA
eukprot:g980.t1